VVRAILLLKFKQIAPLGVWFAERLAEAAKAEGDRLAADVVVPVPLHRERERERGYNQARSFPSHWQKGSDCRTKRCC
jgi:predicted amidophosphoribosyltransferase